MSNVSQWSTSAASNNSAPPDGFPEGQAPSTVNDCSREVMAAVARQFQDSDGSLVTAGTGVAYTLTTNNANAALADIGLLVFRAHLANTGSATLAVDGLTAKTIQADGNNLVADDLVINSLYVVAYNATNDTFDLLNASVNKLVIGTDVQAWDGGLDDISGLAVTDGNIIVGDGANWVAESGATARTSLGAADSDLSEVDFSGLTAIEGNALAATDNFLVMDGTTTKQMEYQGAGLRVQSAQTTQTLAADDMNTIMEFDAAATVTLPANATTALPVGAFVVICVDNASAYVTVTADTGVTLNSVFHAGGAAAASDTVQPGGTAVVIKTATNEWYISGDVEDT